VTVDAETPVDREVSPPPVLRVLLEVREPPTVLEMIVGVRRVDDGVRDARWCPVAEVLLRVDGA
jgi:hypothetical protein